MSMSRIGKQPVSIPKGVKLTLEGPHVSVKGPKGQLERTFKGVELKMEGDQMVLQPPDDSRTSKAMHGLCRSLLANMVEGVEKGFERVLEVNGVGYRAEEANGVLTMSLGFSHPVVYTLPDGVSAQVERQTKITLSSIDKELLGQTAAKVRSFRPPEPYKGKGIKYAEETIQRKVGKSA